MAHPSQLTPEQIEDYLYCSYTRVDGLWFVLTEEQFGFEAALALDAAVWKVVPKIQARLLQKHLRLGQGLEDLSRALNAKLTLDRYQFTSSQTATELAITIASCPWHELILRSGREHLAERIGGVICGVELPVFAKEFNCSCPGAPEQRLCRSGQNCVFRFQAAAKS
jgi:hypothetical protein